VSEDSPAGYTRRLTGNARQAQPPADLALSLKPKVPSSLLGVLPAGHTHPGILLLALAADSGPIDWYDANCQKTVYSAGYSWTEGTKLHDVVNSSSQDAHFVVTYVAPKGVNKRTDQPAPACAAALGLQ
jgi:hypothetical protein